MSFSHTCTLTLYCCQTHWLTSMYDETVCHIKPATLTMQMWWLLSLVGFREVNWRFELTAPPFLLLGEDKDQGEIWVSAASHAAVEGGFLKVRRYNWLSDRADVCGGRDRPRERRVWQIYGTAMRIVDALLGYLNCIGHSIEVGGCAMINRSALCMNT